MTRPRSYILFFISKWLLIAYSLLSSFLYFSQTYTSINDGAWNNTTNVWSLDGVTPCGCQPGHVDALIVIVQNNLTLSGDLEIKNAGNLTISSIGEITTSSKGVRVINGLLTNHGIFNIKSLEVKSAGVVTLSGKSTFDNKFFIEGSSYKGNAPEDFIIGTWWNHEIIKYGAQISALFEQQMLEKIDQYPMSKSSSMLSDRLSGQRIELGAKNGIISNLSKVYKIATPLNDWACTLLKYTNVNSSEPNNKL